MGSAPHKSLDPPEVLPWPEPRGGGAISVASQLSGHLPDHFQLQTAAVRDLPLSCTCGRKRAHGIHGLAEGSALGGSHGLAAHDFAQICESMFEPAPRICLMRSGCMNLSWPGTGRRSGIGPRNGPVPDAANGKAMRMEEVSKSAPESARRDRAVSRSVTGGRALASLPGCSPATVCPVSVDTVGAGSIAPRAPRP